MIGGIGKDGGNKIPLSLKMMHRPSRAQTELDKALDPTKLNSLLNSQVPDYFSEREKVNRAGSASTDSQDSANSSNCTSPNFHPSLVRKRSGEIVKPSIKEGDGFSRDRRALSLPTTPTYKLVHFDGDDNVKYFKKKDKPKTISATNSPTLCGFQYNYDDDDDNYDDDNIDSRFDDDDEEDSTSDDETLDFSDRFGGTKYPRRSIDWQVKLLNFPPLSYLKKIHEHTPVFLERIFVTFDKKYLVGQIAVKNLSFEKSLTVRYSLDNWGTIIELQTSYQPECPDVLKTNNYDRFEFKIPVESLYNSFNLNKSSKSKNTVENDYQLCIRYYANNQEFWDNNFHNNYLIKLIKIINIDDNRKPLPNRLTSQNSKIQDHFEKPKYSSSYLKRRSSDSEVEKKKEQASDDKESKKESIFTLDNQSSDFLKNNFYLTSPLLSLYNNDENLVLNKKPNERNITLKSMDKVNTAKFNNQKVNTSTKFNHSQSYKELLDNYCFFNAKDHEAADIDGKKKENSKKAFGVSSFLGNL